VADDFARARAAGLSHDTLVHAVVLSAFFNYLNRVADATGLEYDREVVIATPATDAEREPIPRLERASWPRAARPSVLAARRPATAEALAAWQAHVLDRSAPLEPSERRQLAWAAAESLCDAATAEELGDAVPAAPRAVLLDAYARKLTETPWRVDRTDLDALRRVGLDDAGLLDVVAVVAFQNAASRIRLGLRALV
jgi:hypothetical protein